VSQAGASPPRILGSALKKEAAAESKYVVKTTTYRMAFPRGISQTPQPVGYLESKKISPEESVAHTGTRTLESKDISSSTLLPYVDSSTGERSILR
jgi:hypothetical protein